MLLSPFALLQLAVSPAAPHAPPAAAGAAPPNIVLVVADDMGVDLVGAYGEAPGTPCTPHLDQLAAEGLLFRNAWTSPQCTPSRAQILTGRHSFRTGLGEVDPISVGLALEETTLPEMLVGYSAAALGKWGLGGGFPDSHPNDSGFGRFAGSLPSHVSDYFAWDKTVDGVTAPTTTYATTDTVDEAILAAQTLPQPWLLYVCFNAPHRPVHVPPSALCPSSGACPSGFCAASPTSEPDQVRAMAEAMDTELGRLLAAVDAVDPDAYVVFLGDNGTNSAATLPPFDPVHAKGSVYEGGVRVPLIVAGPGVVHGECDGLVSSTDLAATFTELAGLTTAAEDSVSLVPYFADPTLSLRSTVYVERFEPNHAAPPYDRHDRALRDARYKLIRRLGVPDELYDVVADRFETLDLFPTLAAGTPEYDAYVALAAELGQLQVEPTVGVQRCSCDATAAPCANPCAGGGCENSLGLGALLTATGSLSIAQQTSEPLVLHVTQARPSKNAVWLQGAGPSVQIAFRDGNLCVGNPTLRLPGFGCGIPIADLDSSGALATDDPTYGFDVVSAALCKGDDVAAAAPTTREYQLWYRDGMGPCASGSNTTNAVVVEWVP